MWDVLMLMKRAKNCSFTVVPSVDGLWGGACYGLNNCTGMIGMTNRKEIDIAIGEPYLSLMSTHHNDIHFTLRSF